MPKCDHCPTRAIRVYQRIWHVFDVRPTGRYGNERIEYEIEEPLGVNNLHLCLEHEARFLAGSLQSESGDHRSDLMTVDELTKFVLRVCEAQNGLCMDVPWERRRLAQAIGSALYRRP